MKFFEIFISYFFDLVYDVEKWDVDSIEDWVKVWIGCEFGIEYVDYIVLIMICYGMYVVCCKYEFIEVRIYFVFNYNEVEVVLD